MAKTPADEENNEVAPSGDAATINEVVYNSLKQEILGNRLRPGFKLVHQALAESLGVSRTPIRESLERLYQEGLLIRVKNRGYYVAEIDAREVGELYETRLALEAHTVRRLLERGLRAADLAILDKLHTQYGETIGTAMARQRILIDRDFHLAIAEMSANQYLFRSLSGIFERLMLKRRVDGYSDTGERPFQEHARFLVALKAKDQDRALLELGVHIDGGRTRLIRHLATLTEPEFDRGKQGQT